MRSYQIHITVHSPLTLRYPDRADDREAMSRLLSDLLTDVSIDVAEYARSRLEQARKVAADVGCEMLIPELDEPMGAGYGFTDVTGHIGQRWRPRGKPE